MKYYFNDKTEADLVLNYYEKYLFRCQYLIFAAVTQEISDGDYFIQLGVDSKGKDKVTINTKLSREEILDGRFKVNEIPYSLPIPGKKIENAIPEESKIDKSLEIFWTGRSEISINDTSLYEIKKKLKKILNWLGIEHVSKRFIKGILRNISRSYRKRERDNTERELKAGLRIHNGKRNTTLGAIFKLTNHSSSGYFGITNEHLFHSLRGSLGDEVKSSKGKIGELFWKSHDTKRDAAIIKLENPFTDRHKINREFFDLKIAKPEFNSSVIHNGFKSATTSVRHTQSIIFSTNATVRVFGSSFKGGNRIYTNQILIKENTDGGDSGSLVISSDQKTALGLNFGRIYAESSDKNDCKVAFSVANNINNIFNHEFKDKMHVLHKKNEQNNLTITISNKFLIQSFKL